MALSRRRLLALAPSLLAASAPIPAIADYEGLTGGRLGLWARNTLTGASLAWRADERFVMCSTFKASLAACVLARVDQGKERLAAMIAYGPDDVPDWHAPAARAALARGALSVDEMCKAAVELSDNTCANLLLKRIGGPAALTAFWRASGDEVSRLDHDEPLLNRSPPGDPHDTTTPRAMGQTLGHLTLGEVLSQRSRERLTGWLIGCQTGADRLRAGLPAGWRIGDKTGNNGTDAAGDIAVSWRRRAEPLLIAAYVQGGTPTPAQIAAVFKAIGQAAARLVA
jgi:beta-lactamase class A